MTRPKVPEDKRQRTAHACDICKRRKQKCDGKKPCATCVKRNLSCAYTTANPAASGNVGADGIRSSAKRRFMHDVPNTSVPQAQECLPGRRLQSAMASSFLLQTKSDPRKFSSQHRITPSTATETDGRSRQNTASEPDEEAEVYGQTRMLQDSRGRLLYVGDSATLSYLQLIRMIVDHASGPSPFTMDPSRHKIMEAAIAIPADTPIPHVVPDRETASILVEAFFTNTCGLIDVLDRRTFEQFFDACYTNPLVVDASNLCLMHLTLAIGLVMATPAPNSREEAVIKALRGEPIDRAEVFFRAARSLGDPVSGFEDADLWSVQALSLMSVYMLAVSKRNAAYAYYGMAVRTAFALGLHRIREVPMVFPEEHVVLRRNIWRSLFVLDRFLSASLGRPAAISEEDCSEGSLDAPSPMFESGYSALQDDIASKGLDAAVKACQSIGQILKKVYSKRRISTRIAQQIADDCDKWARIPRPELDARKLFKDETTPAHGIAILHVHLFNCHATILLSRPFFLYLLIKTLKGKPQLSRWHRRPNSKLEKFAEACLTASARSLVLVRAAHRANYLPQRNPFILYFLFAATLIIISNEFAGLYRNGQYESLVSSAKEVLSYCAQSDVQAHRLLFIIDSFHSVVQRSEHTSRIAAGDQARFLPILMSDRSLTESLGSLTCGLHGFLDQHVINGMSGGSSRRSSSTAIESNRDAHFKSHSTAPMPNMKMTSGPRPFPPKSSSTASSASSRAANADNYVTIKTEPDMADSLGGEHEFDFDSFWDIGPGTGFCDQDRPAAQPRSANIIQPPRMVVGNQSSGLPIGFGVPATRQVQGQAAINNLTTPGMPLYTRTNF